MSQGRDGLLSTRLRLETSNGGAASPRYIWRGLAAKVKDAREVKSAEEQIGVFGGGDRPYVASLSGDIQFPETELTFEQGMIPFAAAGFGSAGGSAHGASGSAVAFYLPIPAGTVWPTQSFTIESGHPAGGLGGEAKIGTYAICNEISISGAGQQAIMIESSWVTRTVDRANAAGSFSNVGTAPAVETVIAGAGTVYLDPAVSGATYGASAVPAGNVLGFKLKFSKMWALKYPVDSGNLYWHTAVFVGCEITGEMTFEAQATGTWSALGTAGQEQRWRTLETQLLRLNFPGGTIPIGTGFQNKLFRADLPITYQEVDAYDSQEGNTTVTMKFYSKANQDVVSAGRGTILFVRRGQQEMIN